jgi:hypothetical protein
MENLFGGCGGFWDDYVNLSAVSDTSIISSRIRARFRETTPYNNHNDYN